MFLVDSHCHLDKLDYKVLHQDIDEVIYKARINDVKLILSVCTTLSGFYSMVEMIGCRDDVLFSCGIHPLSLNDESCDFTELRQLASREYVVAIGETGLDYYYQRDNIVQQQAVFRQHIRIGRELNKPIILHSRLAKEDTLAILNEEQVYECGGVLHCCTEDRIMINALLNLGLYISFSGIVTFHNAEVLRDSVRFVPLERLLIETDSPYLTPVPYRGKENQPAYVRNIADYIATLKKIPLTQLVDATTANFIRLFRIDKQSKL